MACFVPSLGLGIGTSVVRIHPQHVPGSRGPPSSAGEEATVRRSDDW